MKFYRRWSTLNSLYGWLQDGGKLLVFDMGIGVLRGPGSALGCLYALMLGHYLLNKPQLVAGNPLSQPNHAHI